MHNALNDKQAYDSLPQNIRETLRTTNRVILIANNPSITKQTLNTLLKPDDVLVLFNHFIHADFLTTHLLAKTLPKLLFFRQIGDSQLHFGLPPRHNNVAAIEQMITQAEVGFLFTNIGYQFPTLADDPSPDDDPIDETVVLTLNTIMTKHINSPLSASVIGEDHPIVDDYPAFEDIHSSAPSSGFFMYRLMRAVQAYVKQDYANELELVLLGFNTDDKTDYFWKGHNWAFEREQMANLPTNVRLIKQF